YIPFCDFGEVLDPSSADVTAHVLELLGRLGFSTREPHTRRALAYLLGQQERNGSWYGRWGVNYVYGTSAALQALAALRFGADDAPVAAAVGWLRHHQNEDGGWGESCRSYEDRTWHGRGRSTASQTAWGILGLLPFVGHQDAGVTAAAHWLMEHQSEDGTWDEPEFTGTGFPGDFFIKYHEYRNYFPLLALAQLRQQITGAGEQHPKDRPAAR
ncbi:MAG: squalene--hopene cyclase, partial [Anaerolineae bacterium]